MLNMDVAMDNPAESGQDSAARPQRRTSQQKVTHSLWRLVIFLIIHICGFGAELTTITFFGMCGSWPSFGILVATVMISGAYCTFAAMECRTPALGCKCLPLKEQPCLLRWLLALPLGLGQGVVIALAVDEHKMQLNPQLRPSLDVPLGLRVYSCKAVNGIFESIISAAVVLYNYWGLGYPEDHPISTCPPWDNNPVHIFQRRSLKSLGLILLASGGLGLLELDACVSPRIAKRMKPSMSYEFVHWSYRTCEVVSRVSMITVYMIITQSWSPFWWMPLAVDLVLVLFLVVTCGGSEISCLVVIVCSIPCVFANLFRFIDSPYKRRAARRISFWLNLRNFIQIYIFPFVMAGFATLTGHDVIKELRALLHIHTPTTVIAVIAIVLYWPLHWFVGTLIQRDDPGEKDIFTACQRNDVRAVEKLTQEVVGISMNCYDIDGKTPLMLAILGSNPSDSGALIEICKMLIKDGAKIDLRMFSDTRFTRRMFWKAARRRWTALHLAAMRGCSEQVFDILIARANLTPLSESVTPHVALAESPRFLDECGETPLHVAVRYGHTGVAKYLASKLPQWVMATNRRSQTPYDLAHNSEMRQALDPENLGQPLNDENMGPAQSTLRNRMQSLSYSMALWPKVVLQISQTSDEEQLEAPGLCSFLASSAGGPLGRFFCNAAPLPSIDEDNALDEQAKERKESGQGEDLEIASPTFVSRPIPPTPAIEDLEPAASDGGTSVFWRDEMAHRSRRGGRAWGAGFASLIPPEAILGQGTYGVVWRAFSMKHQATYAVKNVRTQHERVATLAARECQVADRIRVQPHPCIVHLFRVHHFPEVGLFMQVMEFCSGGDVLDQIAKERRRADSSKPKAMYTKPQRASLWIGQIFLGLEHLHVMMHALLRDLKPENVVLDEGGRAKLTDFGFGRFGAESSGTWTFGCPPGSPGYICPEILNQQKYDFKADLYSYGVLVWVLLSGGVTYDPNPRPPWGTRRDAADFKAHLNDWRYIKECIEQPDRCGARKLPDKDKAFVAALTQRKAKARPDHKGIRASNFMQDLRLPPPDAGREQIEIWIESRL